MNKLLLIIPLLLMLGIGLGALVNYLSNSLTKSVEIDSPLSIHDLGGTLDGTVYGGDTRTVTYQVDNRANNPILGKHQLIIYCDDFDLNGSEIVKVEFSYNNEQPYQITDSSVQDVNGDGKKELVYTSNIVTHEAQASNVVANWTITFNPAIQPGNYSFETQVVPG